MFKKDLGSFTRLRVYVADRGLRWQRTGKTPYARNLRPLLRETATKDDEVDLSNISIEPLPLVQDPWRARHQAERSAEDFKLEHGNDLGAAKPRDKKSSCRGFDWASEWCLITGWPNR